MGVPLQKDKDFLTGIRAADYSVKGGLLCFIRAANLLSDEKFDRIARIESGGPVACSGIEWLRRR